MQIGFSTGSLAQDDFRLGIRMAAKESVTAVELSALRERELDPLINDLDSIQEDLGRFTYVSLHAPSRLEDLTEAALVEKLQAVAHRFEAIVVHPDVIRDFGLWRALGRTLCIENMDRRKSIGRTAAEFRPIFAELPDATFCFDIGHARQVDPTMQEARSFLVCFGDRLRQVHMSSVNSQSGHERLNVDSVRAFREVAHWIKASIPLILETPVDAEGIEAEVAAAASVFDPAFSVGG